MEGIIIGTLVPLGICVVLPVLVVWLFTRAVINKENRNADVLIEAIRNNAGVDTDKLAQALGRQNKSPRELLNLRLLRGAIFSLIGVVFVIATIILVSGGYGMSEIFGLLLIVGGVFLAVGIGYLIVFSSARNRSAIAPKNKWTAASS